jgi:pyruvyltransferase
MKNVNYNLRKLWATVSGGIQRNSLHVYWWDDQPNFGDLITPELLRRFGRTPIHRFPSVHRKEDWSMVGSLLHMLPSNYCGNVLGSGLIRDMQHSLPNARIWSVRGELTKRAMGLSAATPTGDLGLLADRLVPLGETKTHQLGLIPHFVDKNSPWVAEFARRHRDQVLVIDVERSAQSVIADIARCRWVASSSLHGIIVADCFDIPTVWLGISDAVIGAGFKFRDYFSSLDAEQSQVPTSALATMHDIEHALTSRNRRLVEQKKIELEALLQRALRAYEGRDSNSGR